MGSAVYVDGSMGEGGGQILRSALALSAATGRPLRMVNIRAGRKKPGLQAQHLAAVRAVALACAAEVEGAALGADRLEFIPGAVTGGALRIAVGTAGATTLVAHAVLPALVHAGVPAALAIDGGTHVSMAPVYEHFQASYLPMLLRMGAVVSAELGAHGFFPRGDGRLLVQVQPGTPRHLEVLQRGVVTAIRVVAIAGRGLRPDIVPRELAVLRERLGRPLDDVVRVETPRDGHALVAIVHSEQGVEVFSALGERGVRAEAVAEGLAAEVRAFVDDDVPVGSHLADQLLLPLALGAGGVFDTQTPTPHTLTNIEVIRRFLPVQIEVVRLAESRSRIRVSP